MEFDGTVEGISAIALLMGEREKPFVFCHVVNLMNILDVFLLSSVIEE